MTSEGRGSVVEKSSRETSTRVTWTWSKISWLRQSSSLIFYFLSSIFSKISFQPFLKNVIHISTDDIIRHEYSYDTSDMILTDRLLFPSLLFPVRPERSYRLSDLRPWLRFLLRPIRWNPRRCSRLDRSEFSHDIGLS